MQPLSSDDQCLRKLVAFFFGMPRSVEVQHDCADHFIQPDNLGISLNFCHVKSLSNPDPLDFARADVSVPLPGSFVFSCLRLRPPSLHTHFIYTVLNQS